MTRKNKKSTRSTASKLKQPQDRVYFFRMNGCGHCESVREIWPQVVNLITRSRPMVQMIEVESEEKDRVLDDYAKRKLDSDSINAYPDLRILAMNGKTSTFNSERTVPSIVSWIEEHVTQPRRKSKKTRAKKHGGGAKHKSCNRRGTTVCRRRRCRSTRHRRC